MMQTSGFIEKDVLMLFKLRTAFFQLKPFNSVGLGVCLRAQTTSR